MGWASSARPLKSNPAIQSTATPPPEKSRCEESEAQREVVIHEAHLERPAVGDHGDGWNQEPRRTPRSRRNECKRAPEKDQHTRRHNNLFRRGESEAAAQLGESAHPPQRCSTAAPDKARGVSPFNQLRQPCVVGVAGKIASFDVLVPEARQEQNQRRLPRSAAIVSATNSGAPNESEFLAQVVGCKPEVGEKTVAFIDVTQTLPVETRSAQSCPLEKPCAAPQAWVRRLSGRATARDSTEPLRPHPAGRNPSSKKSSPRRRALVDFINQAILQIPVVRGESGLIARSREQ